MLEVLFKRIFYGTFLPGWCTAPPRPVAGSEDEVLLTAPEIDCSSQITVTAELSFAFSAPETSPVHIRKIKSSVQEVLTLFFWQWKRFVVWWPCNPQDIKHNAFQLKIFLRSSFLKRQRVFCVDNNIIWYSWGFLQTTVALSTMHWKLESQRCVSYFLILNFALLCRLCTETLSPQIEDS